jgi:hypothetical protein
MRLTWRWLTAFGLSGFGIVPFAGYCSAAGLGAATQLIVRSPQVVVLLVEGRIWPLQRPEDRPKRHKDSKHRQATIIAIRK